MRNAAIPEISLYGVDVEEEVPAWTGPVERRDPDVVRQPSVQLTWRCRARHCRQFTMNGAYKTGRCNWCGAPRG